MDAIVEKIVTIYNITSLWSWICMASGLIMIFDFAYLVNRNVYTGSKFTFPTILLFLSSSVFVVSIVVIFIVSIRVLLGV